MPVGSSPYEIDIPLSDIISPVYEGTPEQRESLRTVLRQLTREDPLTGKRARSTAQILMNAGVNSGENSPKYDPSALARFIDGSTKEIKSIEAARSLYRKWIGKGNSRIDLSQVDNVFYHGALIAMDAKEHSQLELARVLSGHYFFYKRSAVNPDFFVQGLLTVIAQNNIVHVTELQFHAGGRGLPRTEEIDEGFAVMKGNIIYVITRSRALKGATFTIINNHPIGRSETGSVHEQIMSLYGYQIGGREFTSPTSSPFAAERISSAEARRAREGTKSGDTTLRFRKDLPDLMERHFRV